MNNKVEVANYFNYIFKHLQMYIQDEFPFEDGVVFLDDKPSFEFHKVTYQGEEKSQIEKTGFEITSMSSKGMIVFYCGIRQKIGFVDLYVEPINDIGINYFENLSQEQIVFGYAYKFIILIDKIQRCALNSKTILQKISSSVERSNQERGHKAISSNPIRLTGGITYQYVNQYSDKRNYERHTDSWDVRGHYRHYKNGNVVFIKPFKKGDKKQNDKLYDVSF